jgi:anti-sigma B factor antagonist
MEMTVEELDGKVTKVVLSGRLDTAGAAQIDLKFSTIAGARRAIVVDMAGVSFLASLGIRVLLIGAKAAASKGGKLVLLSPDPNVVAVLKSARIDTLIPVLHDLNEAVAAVAH